MFVPFEEISFCLVHDRYGLLRISCQLILSCMVKWFSSHRHKTYIFYITHGKGPKCGWSKFVIIAGKEMGQEMEFLDVVTARPNFAHAHAQYGISSPSGYETANKTGTCDGLSLVPRPRPAFRRLRDWYLFSREHDVIGKWRNFAEQAAFRVF